MGQWRALPVGGRLFESARWLEHEKCFQWVDILAARIFRWTPDTKVLDRRDLGFDFLTLATPSQTPETQLLASRDTVYTYRWGDEPTPFAVLPVSRRARLNDGLVDVSGRLWIGSMGLIPNREEPLGKLWCIDPNGSIAEKASGLGISNGIAWAKGTGGFHVDSLAGSLYSVACEGGSFSRELALRFRPSVEPDGILLVEGIVWIALWEGGALGRFDTSTGQYSEVAVPARRPSSLAMSSDLVLVTTAGQGTGSRLDSSGRVLVNTIDSLEIDASGHRQAHRLMGV